MFGFSDLDKNHEIFSNKNKKVIGRFKTETPRFVWIDEFVCLRPKAFSFKCKNDDESKNKLEGVSESQSKHMKIEEYKKRLDNEDYQKDCDNYIFRSLNHEMYPQQFKKSTLSLFDDKQCYESNNEGNLWE